MSKSYQEHFDERGSAYDRAMRNFPAARELEFKQAIRAAEVVTGMTVADVPAGGGYLERYLPSGCQYLGYEPCASFTNHGEKSELARPLLPLPWGDDSVDAAISLAGVHHIADKRGLFAELRRVVKTSGRLVVSDVAAGSSVAKFLDGYVGAHNTTGHQGIFLSDETLRELRDMGWVIKSSNLVNFNWVFSNRSDMTSFCHSLFDLCSSTLKDTEREIEAQLGIDSLPGGKVGMRWQLMTIVVSKD